MRGGNEVVAPLCYAPSKEWLQEHLKEGITVQEIPQP